MRIQGYVMFGIGVIATLFVYNALNKSVAGGKLPALVG